MVAPHWLGCQDTCRIELRHVPDGITTRLLALSGAWIPAGAAVGIVRRQINASRGALCIPGRTGGGTAIRCALANRVRSRGGTLRIGTAGGRGGVDTGAATQAGTLTARAGSIAGSVLSDTGCVAVLWDTWRAGGNAGGAIAGYRSAGGRLTGGCAFGQAAGGEGTVADADVSAIVVAGGAANRAGAALADRCTVRIGGALAALGATGGGIVVGRAGVAATVVSCGAGEVAGTCRAGGSGRSDGGWAGSA